MPEQSEGNNHTRKINVFPVLHTIFFLLAGQKVDLFAPHGAIKSTLWPASRKKHFLILFYYFFFHSKKCSFALSFICDNAPAESPSFDTCVEHHELAIAKHFTFVLLRHLLSTLGQKSRVKSSNFLP